jgi:hypothetical protein
VAHHANIITQRNTITHHPPINHQDRHNSHSTALLAAAVMNDVTIAHRIVGSVYLLPSNRLRFSYTDVMFTAVDDYYYGSNYHGLLRVTAPFFWRVKATIITRLGLCTDRRTTLFRSTQ